MILLYFINFVEGILKFKKRGRKIRDFITD